MAEILGPTLEQLDAWGSMDALDAFGTLEQLDNLNLFETTGTASVSASATSVATKVRTISATASLAVTQSSSATLVHGVSASVTGAASVAAVSYTHLRAHET